MSSYTSINGMFSVAVCEKYSGKDAGKMCADYLQIGSKQALEKLKCIEGNFK